MVTVSGTVAYEAALLGKTAFTFAPTFFNRLPHCRHITLDHLRNAACISDLLAKSNTDGGEFTAYLLRNTFNGIISDPISNPACMSDHNIEQLALAIDSIIRETPRINRADGKLTPVLEEAIQ